MSPALRALALACSLNPSPTVSSSELLAQQLLHALSPHNMEGETVRIVDHDVKPGIALDMGEGDAWPNIREKLIAADTIALRNTRYGGAGQCVGLR